MRDDARSPLASRLASGAVPAPGGVSVLGAGAAGQPGPDHAPSGGSATGTGHAASGTGAPEPTVLAEVRGRLGLITLNRPRAVNALNHEMVNLLWSQLVRWADDPAIATVAIQGAGERGLCAGGDVVAIHADMTRPDRTPTAPYDTMGFWRDEYRLNLLISRYPKPYVALMDGLVLGGGIGVSAHGSFRVVTERTRSGLPETQIGFSPDVGGTYLLGHAPGAAGAHAALTGAHLDAGDALYLGLADAFVPSGALPELLDRLEREEPGAVIEALAAPAPPSALRDGEAWIEEAYAGRTALDVVRALEASEAEEARGAAEVIRGKSPTAVAVALAAVRAGAGTDLAGALKNEWRVGYRFLGGHDFAEGIRAQVIDKDRTPKWEPARLEDLSPGTAEAYLAPLPHLPLDLSPVDAVIPPA
ncbi:3-hydroxyisobutyryl-CoA hydrolase [Galactobacter valiniphilus]|uniref:3-hydroxyisobutyryl-CoA hydrolase n=1 Tax=Galactobacter valiniphilus TaxID=2676122 RepID=UPI0018F7CDF2|nr:3-hydroxyisobutyryl-CoA hydrolase [Galactobacter valiniphilus]